MACIVMAAQMLRRSTTRASTCIQACVGMCANMCVDVLYRAGPWCLPYDASVVAPVPLLYWSLQGLPLLRRCRDARTHADTPTRAHARAQARPRTRPTATPRGRSRAPSAMSSVRRWRCRRRGPSCRPSVRDAVCSIRSGSGSTREDTAV